MFQTPVLHLCVLLCLYVAAANAVAADPDATQAAASADGQSEMVLDALQAEADGDLVTRDRLLKLAANCEGDCPAAYWQRGFVQHDEGQWKSIEECLTAKDNRSQLAAYKAQRDNMPDNALGHWHLAVWCLQNGFTDQSRAHLHRTIELAPEHAGARELLGFQRVAGEWISLSEQQEYVHRIKKVQSGLSKYSEELSQIAQDFSSRDPLVRAAAGERLAKIQDPLAIAPMEAILGAATVDSAEAVVKSLATIADPEATKALVRFAIYHPHRHVRNAAIAEIKSRPLYDYVPDLLESLSSPVASLAVPVLTRSGTLVGFRQAFVQAREDKNDVFIRDTQINYFVAENLFDPVTTPATNVNSLVRLRPDVPPSDLRSQLEAIGRSVTLVSAEKSMTEERNKLIVLRNQTIANLLSQVAGRAFSGAPDEMWRWWDEVNETEYQSMRLSNIRYSAASLGSRNYNETEAARVLGPNFRMRHSCFVRGTLVVTRDGLLPIETIRVGDVVLSRNIDSGELSWKPVLGTTRRLPRPIFKLGLDSESLACTGAHLFWVSGAGWTKASELKPGDVLHGAKEPTVLMKIEQRPDEETFNLIVDQTHTYFVGKQMILSHDVTDRAPTYVKVPGLPVGSVR